ncbi:MAG: hypothetical protein Q4G16_11695 [Cruoricaptor ignavus]|nr:hypothetical protein [Cruoricaptor ignavus]
MDSIKKQKEAFDNAQIERDLEEFNSKPLYNELREFYKENFDKIKEILMSGNKTPLEDISIIDKDVERLVLSNQLFLKQFNRGIFEDKIKLEDIS